ncbi:UNVERIFIED_CONTAM: SEC10/PgrA surface exclusion domain-containing protein [Streptococcus canis]
MKKHVISALAVATLGLGTSVSAEEIVTAPEKAPESDTQAKSVKAVTEADVKVSEDKLTEATSAINAQKEVVAKAEVDKETAETAVSTAQAGVDEAEALVKEATPEAIEAVTADIAKIEISLPEADKAITMAEGEVSKAETAVSDQETVVNTVKADLSAKEEAVVEAQADVDKAQAILDGTNQASVVAEAEEAEKALETAQANLESAEAELAKAKEADAKRVEAISDLTTKVGTAREDLSAKKEALTQANAKAEETGTTLAQATSALAEAENKVNTRSIISLSTEYIEALRDYNSDDVRKSKASEETLKRLSSELLPKHSFKADSTDDNTILNINNLSEEALLDLSNFASDLVNQIRKAFNKPATVVTPSSIRFADLITDGYVADDWRFNQVVNFGHDVKAINQASKALGLVVSSPEEEKRGLQKYENMSSLNSPTSTLTLSKAKSMLYEAITRFMFSKYEWLHASSIAGFGAEDRHYFAVDLSSRTDVTGLHFIQVDKRFIESSSTFDETLLFNPYDGHHIFKEYEASKVIYDKAKEVDDKAKADKAVANKAYANSQAVLNQANQELAEAEAKEVLTPLAQNKRDIAKERQTKALDRNQKAQTALANLSADVKVKQEALVKAKEVLAGKLSEKAKVFAQLALEETKINDLVALVKDKKDSLMTAQKAKETLETKLSDQKVHLERLTNAPKVLETAKSDLAKAKERLKKAVATLEQEVKTLKDLEAKEAEVKGQHAKVLEAYQAVLEARHQAELERQKTEIERAGQMAVPVFDATGKVSAYVSDHQDVSQKALSTSSSTQTKVTQSGLAKPSQVAKANSLPKTNSQESWWLSLLGLLTLANLVIFKTKKEN